MQILLILISSGSLGFVSYLIMRELSILNLPLREKEIEKITLIHFSIFNAIATYLFYWLFLNTDLLTVKLDIEIFSKVILLSLITAALMPIVYTLVIKVANVIFGYIQKNRNLITRKYTPLFEDLFLPVNYQSTFVIIFDFSNEFIHSGLLDRMEYKEGQLYLSFHKEDDLTKYTYDEIIEMFEEEDRDPETLKIVTDHDRKLKYFLIYS